MRPTITSALLLTALASAACHTMKPVTVDQINTLKPARAWVTAGDQSAVVVLRPEVVGDSLVGWVNGRYERFPSAGLKQVIVRTSAPARTALLSAGIAAGVGALVLIENSENGTTLERAIGRPCYCPEVPSCTGPGC